MPLVRAEMSVEPIGSVEPLKSTFKTSFSVRHGNVAASLAGNTTIAPSEASVLRANP
jgi:hypothetical protein